MGKRVYATVEGRDGRPVRLCGELCDNGAMVMVHICRGPRLGGFRLSRFGGRLTGATLHSLFSNGEG